MAKENNKKKKEKQTVSVLMMVLLTVAAVVGLRSLSLLAGFGLSSMFFYFLAGICFFLPLALICAELSTGWPKANGIYGWVTQAFGEKIGFLAVWLQWAQSIVWYPLVLSFFSATLCFIFLDPQLSTNPIFISLTTIIVYWIATYINLRGTETTRSLSSLFVVIGTMLPTILIVLFGIIWITSGHTSETELSLGALIPAFAGIGSIVIAIGAFSAFAGIEVSAVHAKDMKNPAKDYPKAIFISGIIILFIFALGTSAVAIIVPHSELNLVTSLIVAFKDFFTAYNLQDLVSVVAIMICFGIIGQVSTMILGVSKGFFLGAKDANLPKALQYENKNGVPYGILLLQGAVVSLLALLFLIVPSVQGVYWFLSDLYIHIYFIMYLLLFAAAIKLRYSEPKTERKFKIPFGNIGIWIVAMIGSIASIAAFVVGLFPPTGMPKEWVTPFETLTLGMLALALVIPFIINRRRK